MPVGLCAGGYFLPPKANPSVAMTAMITRRIQNGAKSNGFDDEARTVAISITATPSFLWAPASPSPGGEGCIPSVPRV